MQSDEISHRIEVLTPQGSVPGILSVTESEGRDDCLLLRLEFLGEVVEERGGNCWEGLLRIRQHLDARSIALVCYGASENVHASGMSASMGIGDRAYRLTPGIAGRSNDLVCIFETGPDVRPVSVAQQEAFYDQWLSSLRNA